MSEMVEDKRRAPAVPVSDDRLAMIAREPARALQSSADVRIKSGELRSLAEELAALRANAASPAARDLLAERRRQLMSEGWTPEHDDQHAEGQMANAAAAYAQTRPFAGSYIAPGDIFSGPRLVPRPWPWGAQWWKPKDRRQDLVRAGALIVAEIERIDRAACKETDAHEAHDASHPYGLEHPVQS